jgi:8-amino-7-oxononanoate synthase
MKRSSSEVEAALAQLDREHLRRERRTIDGYLEQGSRVSILVYGRPVVDFSSNDYLGLARHPAVAEAMSECASRCGAGSGAAHLVTGHGSEHARLEEELAAFTGRERALLFSTGYMANLAVMATFADRTECVVLDRLSHASLIDGSLLSGARLRRYAHSDAAAAESILARHSQTAAVIATDGVFSMDGDVAPLPALARVARAHDAWLIVDDAHGLGVVGENGRGTVEHFSLDEDDVPVLVGTLGKAFGSFGAFVAGSANVIELLMQKARPYIYTTALPQPVAAATRKAIEIAQRESWRRERVLALAARFREGAGRLGVSLAPNDVSGSAERLSVSLAPNNTSGGAERLGVQRNNTSDGARGSHANEHVMTPIQPLIFGSSEAALAAQQRLDAAGFRVVAIRPPTVPRGSARLRVTLSASHTESQVDALLDALSQAYAHREVPCT